MNYKKYVLDTEKPRMNLHQERQKMSVLTSMTEWISEIDFLIILKRNAAIICDLSGSSAYTFLFQSRPLFST